MEGVEIDVKPGDRELAPGNHTYEETKIGSSGSRGEKDKNGAPWRERAIKGRRTRKMFCFFLSHSFHPRNEWNFILPNYMQQQN